MTSHICQKIIFWGCGAFLLILGGIACVVWPIVFNQNLRSQLVLTNHSKSYNLWKETPIPMYIDFYMFNWTNPEETLTKNAVPQFIEMGPYVFSETHEKTNIVWNKNGTVTFKQVRKWVFVPELSLGSLSDRITNVNVIAMTIGNMAQNYLGNKITRNIINTFLLELEAKVYITKTVGELIFDGYNDPFLTLVNKLKPIIKIDIPMDKFGWFYNRNMSADFDGVFNINTGEKSLDNLGLLTSWNYKNKTNFYKGLCGSVGGSTGELWPLDAPQKAKATIFATDLCSQLNLDWDSETYIHGAEGSVFKGRSTVFGNSTSCYCLSKKCPPSGVREISTCRFNAPAYISYPHFYLADPIFRQMVSGMEPSESNHTFDLTLHKITAVPLSVNAKLQINILVDKIPGLNFYNNLPRAYMPMLWFNQRAYITPKLASQLSEVQMFGYFEPSFYAVSGFGAILLIIGLLLWSSGRWKSSGLNRPLLHEQPMNVD